MPCVGICSFSIIAIQLIGAAYFQAAEMLRKLMLTLSKQAFLNSSTLLPNFFGILSLGAFPIVM
jgi:hypothetical protein